MSSVTHFLSLLAIVAITRAELVCPGFGFVFVEGPCVNQCSPDNDLCPAGQKCCYTPFAPCGYRCLIGKENIPKPGACPSPDSDQKDTIWIICDVNNCDVDGECPCNKKCCRNRCGANVCIAPVKTKLANN